MYWENYKRSNRYYWRQNFNHLPYTKLSQFINHQKSLSIFQNAKKKS
jgi:hypothetical protein